MDIIIRDVDIIDGTGSAAFHGDIGIQGSHIADIGDLSAATADTVIDGAGLTAAPGFIDIHSHSDFTLPINPRAESKVRQGVTTEVVGQCGGSPAPVDSSSADDMKAAHPDLPWEWQTFAEFLEYLRRQGLSVNVVPLVGHGTIRRLAVGPDDRAPTAGEMQAMKELVAQALDEGAWGLSKGTIYPPGIYASTAEIIELSRVVARRGGFYFSHIRGEDEALLEAVQEAIEIGEQGGLPVQIAHFKAHCPENWSLLPRALSLVEGARARGLDVTADRYPYTASSTGLSTLLPDWAKDGGRVAVLGRLENPEERQRVMADISARPNQWDSIHISYSPDCPEFEGLTVLEIAERQGTDPVEAVLDILREANLRVSIVHFAMSEDNLRTVLRHEAVMIGSDGSALIPEGPLGEGKAHPRNYGTFPRVLGKYVREAGVLSLSEAIHKMTGLPAHRLGLSDRGLLRQGLKGDLVLFDPDTVNDTATYAAPYQYPAGIEYVFVNGEAVVTPDGHTGALPGAILQRGA